MLHYYIVPSVKTPAAVQVTFKIQTCFVLQLCVLSFTQSGYTQRFPSFGEFHTFLTPHLPPTPFPSQPITFSTHSSQ